MNTYDLAVIGGGPAGLAAAIAAARHGASVLLAERGRFPRHRVCGEFVSAESLMLLESLLQSGSAAVMECAVRIEQGRLFHGSRVIAVPIAPAAASIARFDLDAALWDAAVAVGVDARQDCVIQAVAQDEGGEFELQAPAGTFRSRAVIQAAGRWSQFSQHTSTSDPAQKWIGLKAHFAETTPARSVDLYFFEGGYCGVQPVDLHLDPHAGRRINAAALVRADVARSLEEVLRLHPALARRSAEWQRLTEPVATSQVSFRKPQPLAGNHLLTGDAAAFVDPFVGDGISLALRSGALAADSLARFWLGQQSLAEAGETYAAAHRRQWGPVFRNAALFRAMLTLPLAVRDVVAAVLTHTPALTRQMVRLTR